MQRLVLAALLVAVILTVAIAAQAMVRRALAPSRDVAEGRSDNHAGTSLSKISYGLLVGLVLYVTFAGAD